jgi:hypothetical protein
VLLKLPDLKDADSILPLLVGVLMSAIVGMIAIGGLLRFVQHRSYLVFAYYRWALAIVIIAFFFARGGSEGIRAAQSQQSAVPAAVVPASSVSKGTDTSSTVTPE